MPDLPNSRPDDVRQTIECAACGVRLLVVADRSGDSDPFQLFVCCISCGSRVPFQERVGRVRWVALVD